MGLSALALLLASKEVFIHYFVVLEAAFAFVLAVVGIPELFKSRFSIPGYCCMLMPRLELSPLLVKPWWDRRIAE